MTRPPGATELVRRIVSEHRVPWTDSALLQALALTVDEARYTARGREVRPVLHRELMRLLADSDRVRCEELDALRGLR